ncbi:MAG TPA: WGR domain-containing protein [Novosphingobium sp.]|nr:WGR domain-containing protein [Novosphingobium sp.]
MKQALSIPFALHLEARDPARNIARRYAISVSRDLFGAVVVELAWGRIGARGTRRRHAFAHGADARRFVLQVLRRRAGLPARMGLAYARAGQRGGR